MPTAARCAMLLAVAALGLSAVVAPGCGSRVSVSGPGAEPWPTDADRDEWLRGESGWVQADWSDVDAAVDLAAEIAEMAPLSRTQVVPGSVKYRLWLVEDEPASLWLRVQGGPDALKQGDTPGESVIIEITATVGRFGDPERERALVDAIANRLRQLRDKSFSPIR